MLESKVLEESVTSTFGSVQFWKILLYTYLTCPYKGHEAPGNPYIQFSI